MRHDSIETRGRSDIHRSSSAHPEYATIEDVVSSIASRLAVEDPLGITDRLALREMAPWSDHRLTLLSRLSSLVTDRRDLVTIRALRNKIEILPHQINAALKVLTKMGSRGILADEVGLGKTIEAGIVLKELAARGLASRILILTPASLVNQWMEEMRSKFGEEFLSHDDPRFKGFSSHDRIIASIDTAKMDRHMPDALAQDWDLVIVDEAHYLKNRNTQRYRFLESLFARYLLFLTATPMQNSLKELFNLIHLVRPGLLGSENHFQDAFMADTTGRAVRNPDELQTRLQEVMLRNRRVDTGIRFTERIVRTERLEPTAKEKQLHAAVENFVRHHYTGRSVLPLLTLQREVASSPPALAHTLRNMRDEGTLEDVDALDALLELAESTRAITKARYVVDLVDQLDDKVIVYTQYRKTQELVARHLAKAGHAVQLFHGGMTPARKRKALKHFKERMKVLVCTDSGSEGLNLQFANVVVNFDLPWNPMRVEQRIGRVHRIGQTRDVLVVNLSLKDTIEDYVLQVLYEKIQLFQVAIGEMDLIVSNLPSTDSLEKQILDVIAKSKDTKGVKRGLGRIAKDLGSSRATAEAIRQFDEAVFAHFDLATTSGRAPAPEAGRTGERGRFIRDFVLLFAENVGGGHVARNGLVELRFPPGHVRQFRKRRLVAFEPDAIPEGDDDIELVTPQSDLFRRMRRVAKDLAPVGVGARWGEGGVAFHYLVELASATYEWSGLETLALDLAMQPASGAPPAAGLVGGQEDPPRPEDVLGAFKPLVADPASWVRSANALLLERIAPRLDELARSVEGHLSKSERRIRAYHEQLRQELRADEIKLRRRIGELSSRIWFTEDGLRELRMEKEKTKLTKELHEMKLTNNRAQETVDAEERQRLAREYARAEPRVSIRLVAATLLPPAAIAVAAPVSAALSDMERARGVKVEA